jgi:hypothetical protein
VLFWSPRIQEYTGGSSTYKAGSEETDHPAGLKPANLQTQRPTSSVTEIPGAIEGHKKINKPADYKNPGKPLRSGSLATDQNAKANQPVVMEASEVSGTRFYVASNRSTDMTVAIWERAPTGKDPKGVSMSYRLDCCHFV